MTSSILDSVPSAALKVRSGDLEGALSEYLASFDGEDSNIATAIGYLYSRKGIGRFDLDKAFEYYSIGAAGGISYANHALGGLLMRLGKKSEALDQYIIGAQRGRMECAYNAYFLLKQSRRLGEAESMRDLAIKLGHPLAARDQAFDLLFGHRGFKYVLSGLAQYIVLVPKLLSYSRAISSARLE